MEKYYSNNLTIVFLVVCTVLVLICMILNTVSYLKFNFSNNSLRIFSDNFKSYPIIEIKDFSGDCPSGWEPFIDEKWPGFVQGCDCTNALSDRDITRELLRRSCSFNESLAHCDDIPEQAPLPFSVYRQRNLCKKRARENFYDFKKNKKISKEAYCGLGSKLCGKLDTAGNFLCVSDRETCPINQITIQEFNANPPTGKNFTSITLGNGKILYYSNQNATKDDTIHTEIRLSEGLPCLNANQFNTNSRESKYILDANYDFYTCSEFLKQRFYDDRYKSLDNLNYLDLINDNKINSVINRFPQVPVTAFNFLVQTYSRPYFGWKLNCLNDRSFGLDFLSGLADSLESISGKLLALMIISIITFILYFMNFLYWATSTKFCSAILLCIITSLNFAMMIIAFTAYSASSAFTNNSEDIKNFVCGDEYTNLFLVYMFDFMQSLPGLLLWNVLLLAFNLILKICPFFLTCLERSNKYSEKFN